MRKGNKAPAVTPTLALTATAGGPAALIAVHTPSQRRLWEGVLSAQGMPVHLPAAETPLETLTLHNPWMPEGTVLVLETGARGARAVDLLAFVRALAADPRKLHVIVTLTARLEVHAPEADLFRHVGADALLPRLVPGAGQSAAMLVAALRPILGSLDEDAVHAAFSPSAHGALPDACDVFTTRRLDPLALATRMREAEGVARAERRHGLHRYPDCFVGRDATDWLVRELQGERGDAVIAGQTLLELGVFDHVVKAQPFRDGHFFYRFAQLTPRLETLDLATLVERMRARGGLDIARRSYHGKDYDACFVGAEAVRWLLAQCGLSAEEAVLLGQSLVDLGVIHHVVDEHPFVNAHFFYRFRLHEAH